MATKRAKKSSRKLMGNRANARQARRLNEYIAQARAQIKEQKKQKAAEYAMKKSQENGNVG